MHPRTERVDDVLRAVRALVDRSSAPGVRVRAAAAAECGISTPMVERVFAVAAARFTAPALAALTAPARGGQRVGVVLAATVAPAPLRAIALPWLAGAARVTVRPSRRQRALVEAVVEAFACDAITVATELPRDLDAVVAYGGDDTLAALAGGLPPAVAFEGHGHGFGVAFVGPEVAWPAAARAVAGDIAEHDQRGCLSPQTVFVAGDPVAFARALHDALGALGSLWPRGNLTAGEGAAAAQWQGVQAVRARWFRRGPTHAVAALDAPALVPTPGLRHVTVCPADSVDTLRAALGGALPHLTCVGVAGAIDPSAWRFTRARVVAAGTMQDPPLDGPEDPR
jgi:hypothetical protein